MGGIGGGARPRPLDPTNPADKATIDKATADTAGGPFAQSTQDQIAAAIMTPPAAPPDLTDEEVRRAKTAAMRRFMGGGLPDTFLTGPVGDLTPPPTSLPSLKGS